MRLTRDDGTAYALPTRDSDPAARLSSPSIASPGGSAVQLDEPLSDRERAGLALIMIVAEGVASMLLFWPRNEFMVVEGAAMHSAEVLRQTAREFQALHWPRLAFHAAIAAFTFAGFVTSDRTSRVVGEGC